ncbi:CDP-alcohol phosphatidyltransferase family protein [Methylosarcina fibrata]|uniref:CDP-alcohol phosphatidyltransferase family protein n=1 Tax=Methylosarcina fibrata TaxID=105972 RepID=UPI0003636B53|nr:CDP-alcohol phosphatidyltransferase family protein [Methylosarcina fibrata]
MATIYDLKPAFQNRLRPLTRKLADGGFTANQVTLAALALSLATGTLLAAMGRTRPEMYLMLPAVLLIRMALNAIDGMLAREHGMQSPLGAVLNELSDVVSDAALYLPFALLPGVSPTWVVLASVGALLTEMAGVVAVQIGASRRYDGPMGKSDRAFVFGAAGLAIGAGVVPGTWLNGLFGLVLALTLLTVVNRSRRALQEAAE